MIADVKKTPILFIFTEMFQRDSHLCQLEGDKKNPLKKKRIYIYIRTRNRCTSTGKS